MGVMTSARRRRIGLWPPFVIGSLLLMSCSNAERDRVKATTQANYDRATGKLTELTYDRNKNGKVDTWTKMDGSRPISSELDTNEDGKIDRWEEYGPDGKLVKVLWERPKPATAKDQIMKGKPDAVAFMGPDGQPERIEYSEVSELSQKESVVRREYYQGTRLLRAEEDTLGTGVMDRFENFDASGTLVSVELDETGDGKPDRKLTYGSNGIVLIEWEPDGKGGYLKKLVPVKK